MRDSFARIAAIVRKEMIHLMRDPRMLISVLAMPVLQLLLFAYAISFDVRDVPTVTLDQDNTAQSRQLVSSMQQSGFFRVVGSTDSLRGVDAAFDEGRARVAVIVPRGFAEKEQRNEKATMAVLVDGSEPNSAQLGQNYAVALSQRLDREMLVKWANREGLDVNRFGQAEPVVRTWYNPGRRSADFLVPGLMVVIIMIVTIQQTAVTLVRERDQGTLEQLLVSPVRRGELIVGKVAPWVLFGFVDMVVITIVALTVFGIPLRGDVLTLAGSTFLFVLCCLSLGLFISARASSPEVANFMALMVSFLPGFMLSGFAFPLNSVPPFLQAVSYLFPGRYMVTISRGVFLKGATFEELSSQVAALAIYAVVSLTLASLSLSRKL